jgi:FixJ family two-component response regulator
LRRGLESARQNILHALELVAVLRVASNVPKRLEVRPDSETAGRIARLSATQREVLERVIRGESNKTIAFDLGISTKSVETHRSRVMRRLGADSLAELVRMADRAGSSIGRGS